MKKFIFGIALILSMTMTNKPVYSSAQNAIAQADTEAKVLEAANKIKQACGNTELKINVDWTKFDSYNYEAYSLTQSNVMKNFGGVIKSYASYISYLCETKPYADTYKPRVQSLTAINFQGTDWINNDNYREQVTASVDGATLKITTRPNNLAASYEKKIIDEAF